MSPRHSFADLRQVNRWVGWLLLPPAALSAFGLLHALYSYALLTGLSPELPLAHVSPLLRRVLEHDDVVRLTQITLTLLFILFFCGCWLYLAFRNLFVLGGAQTRRPQSALGLHLHIWANLLFALRLMQRLWRESTPESHAGQAERWLVPWWWTMLIGANVCKLVALLQLRAPQLVADWREGILWMLGAYGCYLALFLLTWRLVKRLETLQRAYWQHQAGAGRTAVLSSPS